jgi:transcriptional regulator with XRE-family HTH domain
MAINSKDLFARLPEARRKKIVARAEELIAEEMNLAELRESLRRSQAELAEKCGVQQAAISKLERRSDMRISTLRALVDAMGGTLSITVRFPNRSPVRISQLERSGIATLGVARAKVRPAEEVLRRAASGSAPNIPTPGAHAPTGKRTKKAKSSGE